MIKKVKLGFVSFLFSIFLNAQDKRERSCINEEKKNLSELNKLDAIQYSSAWNAKLAGESYFNNLKQVTNNAVPGRALDMHVDSEMNIAYLALNGGGLWTFNPYNSTNYSNSLNKFLGSLYVSSVCQNPLNKNEIYVSTGDVEDYSLGSGIYKSTDRGKTFKVLKSTEPSVSSNFRYVNIVECHPKSNNEVYAACNQSLYRSKNGGDTWQQVYSGFEKVRGIVFTDNSILISVDKKGIYKSNNGDSGTFTLITSTLPSETEAAKYRGVRIAVCESKPSVVYSLFAAGNNYSESEIDRLKIFKSTDNGLTWTRTAGNGMKIAIIQQPQFAAAINVSPLDENLVFIGGNRPAFSNNGGNSWNSCTGIYGYDIHNLFTDPVNKRLFWDVSDFGTSRITISNDNSTANAVDMQAENPNSLNCAQIYFGDFTPTGEGYIFGAQDWGVNLAPNGSTNYQPMVGDGASCFIHKQKPNIAYMSTQNTNIEKYTGANLSSMDYTKRSSLLGDLDKNKDGEMDDKPSTFLSYFEMNQADGDQLYIPGNANLWRTTNQGVNWQNISSMYNLTYSRLLVQEKDDPTIYMMGLNSVTSNIDFVEIKNSKTRVSNSTSGIRVITNIYPKNYGEPESIISVPSDPNAIYVVTYYGTKIYKISELNLATPKVELVSGNLPNVGISSLLAHPTLPKVLFAGTAAGLFVSTDGGSNWVLDKDFPFVKIRQLRLRKSDNRVDAYTYGYGIWRMNLTNTLNTSDYIEEFEKFKKVSLYPNPSKNIMKIDLQEDQLPLKIKVYDQLGKEVFVSNELVKGTNNFNFDKLSSGIYIVHYLKNTELLKTATFIKE